SAVTTTSARTQAGLPAVLSGSCPWFSVLSVSAIMSVLAPSSWIGPTGSILSGRSTTLRAMGYLVKLEDQLARLQLARLQDARLQEAREASTCARRVAQSAFAAAIWASISARSAAERSGVDIPSALQ